MTAFVPLLALATVLGLDAWVYADARTRARHRSPVEATIGRLTIRTPEAWLLACLLLWVAFFPLYLTATHRNPFR